MNVQASRRAERYIIGHGSRLYVWLDSAPKAAVAAPPSVELEHVSDGTFVVYADPAIPTDAILRLTLAPWPFRGPRVRKKNESDGFWRAVAIGEREDRSSGHVGN